MDRMSTLIVALMLPAANSISQINLNTCSSNSRFCMKQPKDCNDMTSCSGLLALNANPTDPNLVDFELSHRVVPGSGEYIAVGISKDRGMGEDFILACAQENDAVNPQVFAAYNGPKPQNTRLNLQNPPYSVTEVGVTDGWFICRFSVEKARAANQVPQVYALDRKYYLLLASGAFPMPGSEGNLSPHPMLGDQFPVISDIECDFANLGAAVSQPAITTDEVTRIVTTAPTAPLPASITTDKGRITNPPGCDTGCTAEATYSKGDDPTKVLITLKKRLTPGNSYVALGFSEDGKMGNDAVTACVFNSNQQAQQQLSAKLAYNVAGSKSNQVLPPEAQTEAVPGTMKVQNGYYECNIRQSIKPVQGEGKIFDLSKPYFLFLAEGPASASGDLQFHSNIPVISSGTVMVSKGQSAAADWLTPDTKQKLKWAHGLLLLFGWWVFVANAILFARYFRKMWPAERWFGLHIWFQMHRLLNGIGLLSIITGFVCILVAEKGEWVGNGADARNHAIIGLTAIIIGMVQPIGALIRPGPTASSRPIFNWTHRLLGLAGFACSCAAVWFVQEFKSYLHSCVWGSTPMYLMIFYFCGILAVVIALETHLCVTERLQRTRVEQDVPMQYVDKVGHVATVQHQTTTAYYHKSWPCIRLIVWFMFVAISVAVTVTLATFVMLGPEKRADSEACSS